MASSPELNEREAVRVLLNRINDAWLKRPPGEISGVLQDCFDPRMVIKGPGFQPLAQGSKACARSYEDFVRQATVRCCKVSEPDIDLYGNTAVATYSWEMTYELNGQVYDESGHDLFVLTRDEGQWRAVWRAMLPSAAQETPG